MTSYLVTGGAGFIGTHLAQRLVGRGTVTLFDNFRRNSLASVPDLADNPNVSTVEGDVLDTAAVDKAVAEADVVIHLAAIAGVSSYYSEPLRTLQVNVLGTVNLLDAVGRSGADQFVHFSTSEVFGPDAMFVTEESALPDRPGQRPSLVLRHQQAGRRAVHVAGRGAARLRRHHRSSVQHLRAPPDR